MPDEKASPTVVAAGKETQTDARSPAETEQLRRNRSRRNQRKRMIFALAGLAVLVVGFFLWRYLSSFESTDDAQVDVHLYPVSARISGYVQVVHVEDNQYVQRGATLVEIDPKDYQVAVAKAQANLETAEATARALNIDVPISSVDTASQLKYTSSDIENAK